MRAARGAAHVRPPTGAACGTRPAAHAPPGTEATAEKALGRDWLGRGLLGAPGKECFPGDHEALDLRGALVELHDLGVAEELLDRVVLYEPVAAIDLDGFRRDLHCGVGREALGMGGDE